MEGHLLVPYPSIHVTNIPSGDCSLSTLSSVSALFFPKPSSHSFPHLPNPQHDSNPHHGREQLSVSTREAGHQPGSSGQGASASVSCGPKSSSRAGDHFLFPGISIDLLPLDLLPPPRTAANSKQKPAASRSSSTACQDAPTPMTRKNG